MNDATPQPSGRLQIMRALLPYLRCPLCGRPLGQDYQLWIEPLDGDIAVLRYAHTGCVSGAAGLTPEMLN